MDSQPIQGIIQCSDEWFHKKPNPFSDHFKKRFTKKTDLKIHDLAVDMISEHSQKGSLLVSVQAPNIVFGMMSQFPKLSDSKKTVVKPKLKRGKKSTPLGIVRPTHFFWINALIQFIIFIPSLRNMFAFVPHSLLPFSQFIDRYLEEQKDQAVTSARSQGLVECLYSIFPLEMLTERNSLFESMLSIMKLLENSSSGVGSDLLAFHPERILRFKEEQTSKNGWVEEYLENELSDYPPELLIEKDGGNKSPNRQMFLSQKAYELDAFIEYRPDHKGSGSYVSYLKTEGTWYQCDDLRITPLRSINLQIALNRSFVFHYKHFSADGFKNLAHHKLYYGNL